MPLYEPTELRYWDKAKAYNGYTLFGASGTTYLIDMEGNVVNAWQGVGTNPRLLDNGNLLDTVVTKSRVFHTYHELDWAGNIVWEYSENREGYTPHHDFRRIFNKKLNAYTTMFIANKPVSRDEAIAAGCDPTSMPDGGGHMDTIFEVNMDGNIVWEWSFFEHIIQGVDPAMPNYVGKGKTIADYPGKLNLYSPGRQTARLGLHCNAMDYNAELDQVVTNSVQGEFYVIDHGNTFIPGDPKASIALAAGPAGDFLYRWGDPARYGQGEPQSIAERGGLSTGHKQIGGSHGIQWIRPGLQGAGNFLIFNNGQYLFEQINQSYIFEINGFLDAEGNDTGNYVNPPDAGYYTWEPEDTRNTHKRAKQMSRQIVWIYSSKRNTAFYSHIGSGCQRLPNGNTLICSMTEGHIFEVTPEGEVVWEYINPVTKEGEILEILPDRSPMTNPSFRAYRYGPDHPALADKDLTPKGTITGK